MLCLFYQTEIDFTNYKTCEIRDFYQDALVTPGSLPSKAIKRNV